MLSKIRKIEKMLDNYRNTDYDCKTIAKAKTVRAPAPSCGGGQGWGVARTEEIVEGAFRDPLDLAFLGREKRRR